MDQLLLTLRFYASGSLYIVAADFAGVSKATAGKIISRVTNAIANLRPQLARFPLTIGAVDCTHIRIQSPGGNLAENYRNRKGYFSLNVQVVCDAPKVYDIVARWPGASQDSNIFDPSGLRARCENGELGNAVIVGDGGYAVRTYLITPLPNPQTPAQNLFNAAQIHTRNKEAKEGNDRQVNEEKRREETGK
ncbi:hypothetical protein RI129_003002 [Pyrocoelia pectoralis]|uniref:DDE Tnp4 domain-containing protein n=1 Tax=Pyrocoelia pectoralis TaxID=417401 RepID=A0AAN7ZIB5_9COLE